SSGRGRAGVAVIRVSGPASREAIGKLAGDVPAARVANVRRLRDPETGEPLDEALVVFFQAPTSF
ncbi:MAG: tRNA uridine-5-carboxymethylaminomethyl(34) synthesis GTPase MnmE, partial [Desulfuromonadales bacterium]|nr:tRNA uridine-5-carboxymethylaminomethyl(34) synthesis GTPase MnmE [Desulfuromonadales bacterium]